MVITSYTSSQLLKIGQIRAVHVHNCTMNSLNWDDLRYFLALIDAGSLSGAARALRVEHTTVARRIDALEANLKLRLFDRFPKGWSLTAEGSDLVPYAKRMEEEMLSFERIAAGSSSLAGTVRISAPPTLAAYLLAPHLRETLISMPEIDIELVGESREASLTRREADIALRLSRPRAPGLAVKSLALIQYGLYGAQRYLHGRSSEDWQFIGYDESLHNSPQQQWLEEVAAGRRFVFRSNDLAAIFQAAITGLGVVALPHFLGRQTQDLTYIDTVPCSVERKLWLVMHEDVRRSPRVRTVADAIIHLFESQPVQGFIASVKAAPGTKPV
jgi:DNA-binding transcriptional LysR family regulator